MVNRCIAPEGNANIENQFQITVLFPDSSLPETTNGGFDTQEDFRNYIMEKLDGSSWTTTLQMYPSSQPMPDHIHENVTKAFLLQFPYGHSGLPDDKALLGLIEAGKVSRKPMREAIDTFKYLLNHSKPQFHRADFNLILNNIIMKDMVFRKSRLLGNVKRTDGRSMAELYSQLQKAGLAQAVEDVRTHNTRQYSGKPAARFLRTVKAVCSELPHSNEASDTARAVYFSYLMRFDRLGFVLCTDILHGCHKPSSQEGLLAFRRDVANPQTLYRSAAFVTGHQELTTSASSLI